jgi:hypothetical protein
VPFVDRVHLRYIGCGEYESTAPTVYLWRRPGLPDRVITIPAGTRSDLASTPRLLWWFIPPTGTYEDAAFTHDEGCKELHRAYADRREPDLTSREVDNLFRDILREHDRHAREVGDDTARIRPFTRHCLWVGVRVGAVLKASRRPGWWRDAPSVVGSLAVAVASLAWIVYETDALIHARPF